MNTSREPCPEAQWVMRLRKARSRDELFGRLRERQRLSQWFGFQGFDEEPATPVKRAAQKTLLWQTKQLGRTNATRRFHRDTDVASNSHEDTDVLKQLKLTFNFIDMRDGLTEGLFYDNPSAFGRHKAQRRS